MRDTFSYPREAAARDAFVLDRRTPRPPLDPWRHQGVIVEDERQADGTIARVATVFLTGRECPWRCVMCDLWRHTIADDTPRGSIPSQIAAARGELRGARDAVTQMKLYNAGSFFDPRAVPEDDYEAIAAALAGLDRVIVESHPALVGSRVDRFLAALGRSALPPPLSNCRPAGDIAARSLARAGAWTSGTGAAPRLEVAMGLETAHPDALDRLHKRITVSAFARAADELRSRGVALRVFLLISPPFVPTDEQDEWLLRSIDVAIDCGATAISLIPTRPGNGAIDALAAESLFRAPTLADVERSFTAALAHVQSLSTGNTPRVFVDLWDLDAPHHRLHAMNLEQRVLADVSS